MRWIVRSVLVLWLGAVGCSIEFVGLDEESATSILVISGHAYHAPDQPLRVLIDIERSGGGTMPTASANGEPATSSHSRDDGVHHLQWVLSFDATTRVVDVSVDGESWSVPLLTRMGEATCRPDGDVHLPVSLDRSGLPIGERSWRLTIPGASVPPPVWLQADGDLPEPLVLQGSLLAPSRTTVDVRVEAESESGTSGHPVSLRLSTGADWTLPEGCPQ